MSTPRSFYVISNTSPLSNLALIGHLEILPRLYTSILIPQTVADELMASALVRPIIHEAVQQGWLEVEADDVPLLMQHRHFLETTLDSGESAAIALTVHLNANLLLMDERLGRSVAASLGLPVVGVIGILLQAKQHRHILAVKPLLERLVHDVGFRLASNLIARACELAGE